MASGAITVPYAPRKVFLPLHERTQRWASVVAHRRCGKTVACVNETIKAGTVAGGEGALYGYVAPFRAQAKAVAWDYFKRYARPLMRGDPNEAELRIELVTGSRIQLFGADNPDSLRGLGFNGLVGDEFGDWKPSVFGNVIRPALADRRGWGIFIGTPKGRNGFFDIHERAAALENWLQLTLKASETGVIPEEELAELRDELTDDQYRQEFECDFDAALPGALFGREMAELEAAGRIRPDLHDPALPVHVVFDLGWSDDTSIWWFQVFENRLRLIDCYSDHGKSMDHYNAVLRERESVHGRYEYASTLWLPHDGKAKSLQTGRSIEEQLGGWGWSPRIVPQLGLIDGIQAARLTLKDCWFDSRCIEGIQALKMYRRDYDEDKKMFKDAPRHDWTSHYSDGFRYACLVWREQLRAKPPEKPPSRVMTFDQIRERTARRRREAD